MTASVDVEQIKDGLWRIAIPLGGHSVGHVNTYALDGDGDGLVLIDTGWRSSMADLDRGLRDIGHQVEDIRGVLLTHFHVDHCGAAAQIRERSGAWIGMHADDADLLASRYFSRGAYEDAWTQWLLDVGAPYSLTGAALEQVADLAGRVDPFSPTIRLTDGQTIAHGGWHLDVHHTPGHSRGHVCFSEPRTEVLFTGDHIFPRINVSPTYRPQATLDPVGDYLRTLDDLERLRIRHVLPGHQWPFHGLHDRIVQLRTYHAGRSAEVLDQVRTRRGTVWDIARNLGRSRHWDALGDLARLTALGEAYAHVRHLAASGHVTAVSTNPMHWTSSK